MTVPVMPWDDPPAMTPEGYRDDDGPSELPGVEPSRDLDLVTATSLADLLDTRDPVKIATGCAAIRDELLDAVRAVAEDERKASRPEVVRTGSDLRPELCRLADAADVLGGIGAAFYTARDEARRLAADLVDELPVRSDASGDPKRARSIKVADGHGSDLVAKYDQRTELSVDHAEIDDVIVASLDTQDLARMHVSPYLKGARAGIEELRSVLGSSPGYRSTALDVMVKRLEDAGQDELAQRLSRAYARVDKGEPSAKLDRVEGKR